MPKSRRKLLSSTRPTNCTTPTSSSHSSHSSRSTRTTIRSYHTLQKRLSHATTSGNTTLAASLSDQLANSGGLPAYQAASTLGQSAQRGGDTSRVLVGWLDELLQTTSGQSGNAEVRKLRVLEVGALSVNNAISAYPGTIVRRIDLRSNAPEIEEQDFMTLEPTQPWQGAIGYDVLSLSLVLNFVGNSREQGRMLRWTTQFLSRSQTTVDENNKAESEAEARAGKEQRILPAFFLVLPLSCVDNSRYLTEARLDEIMESLGYEKLKTKKTNKLYYSLWRYDGGHQEGGRQRREQVFKKVEVRSGKDRNNFCIVLDGTDGP